MNPTQKPSLLTGMMPVKSTTSAADKILADAKRVTEMPGHVVEKMQTAAQTQDLALSKLAPAFDVDRFIRDFEQDALDGEYDHLGVGDYDKLLIENVQQNMNFVPERDTKVHNLICDSVKRYDVKTRNRVNK